MASSVNTRAVQSIDPEKPCRALQPGTCLGTSDGEILTQASKVQPECLDCARADTDTMGFLGGTSERERRRHGAVA